jgi:hypothetical protein
VPAIDEGEHVGARGTAQVTRSLYRPQIGCAGRYPAAILMPQTSREKSQRGAQPGLGRPRLAHGWRLLYVFAAVVPGSFLGLLFIFTSTPLYPCYTALPRLWGIGVLDDQDLAGSLMLVVGDSTLACALVPLFAGAMERLEQIEAARFAREDLPD